VALGYASYRGIAGHLGDHIQIEADQHGPNPEPRGGHCRLTARVTATHNYNIKGFANVAHPYLSRSRS
jgi:hypothetical protein